jgi:hypothetical protein
LGEERRAIDRLEADLSRRLARFDATRGFEVGGALDTIAWLKQHGRLSGGAAAERVKVATKLAELPLMARAFADGEFSFGQAAVVARAAESVGPESAAELEQRAVEAARELDPSRLRQFTDRLACELNWEAFLADQPRAHQRRRLDLGQGPDGMWIVDGRLDQGPISARRWRRCLGRGPRTTTAPPAQRRADALVDLTRQVLEGGGMVRGTGGQRPHLIVTANCRGCAESRGRPPASCWAATRSRRRRCSASPVTPRSPLWWWTKPATRSTVGAPCAPRRRHCGGAWCSPTSVAGSRDAIAPRAGAMCTASTTGPMEGAPEKPIFCWCADRITACSTRAAGAFSGATAARWWL